VRITKEAGCVVVTGEVIAVCDAHNVDVPWDDGYTRIVLKDGTTPLTEANRRAGHDPKTRLPGQSIETRVALAAIRFAHFSVCRSHG